MEMTIDEFEGVYHEYHSRLYHYALHLTHDGEAASDVAAEVFTLAWKRRGSLDSSRLQGYLYAAVHNQCLNWLGPAAAVCASARQHTARLDRRGHGRGGEARGANQ